MKNFTDMLKKAQAVQEKMQGLQTEIETLSADGQSGAGMVHVRLNGKGALKSIKIDPALLKADEGEILEDLILAAYNDAHVKAEAMAQAKMAELTAGLNLPAGMKLPF